MIKEYKIVNLTGKPFIIIVYWNKKLDIRESLNT